MYETSEILMILRNNRRISYQEWINLILVWKFCCLWCNRKWVYQYPKSGSKNKNFLTSKKEWKNISFDLWFRTVEKNLLLIIFDKRNDIFMLEFLKFA